MRPTYNHTREDSALYPCAECARKQTDAERVESLECALHDAREDRSIVAGEREELRTERDRYHAALAAIRDAAGPHSSGLALVVGRLARAALGVE